MKILVIGASGMLAKPVVKKLEESGIITNMNTIPCDNDPMNTSGLRLRTTELKIKDMKEKELIEIIQAFGIDD